MMWNKKILFILEKVTYFFEVVIAFILLAVVAVKVVEISFEMMGHEMAIISMSFNRILSTILTLVIGVEFTKMMCKHTPETVIDVLLFAIARQMVIYQDSILDMLIGMGAIVGLFAAKKFLLDKDYMNSLMQR